MLGFPREMPKFKKKRIAAMKIGDLPTTDTTIGKGWRDLLRATIKLFKNVTYICVTLGLTVRLLFGVALVSFFAKVLTLKFGGSTAERGLATGAVIVPGSISKCNYCSHFFTSEFI